MRTKPSPAPACPQSDHAQAPVNTAHLSTAKASQQQFSLQQQRVIGAERLASMLGKDAP